MYRNLLFLCFEFVLFRFQCGLVLVIGNEPNHALALYAWLENQFESKPLPFDPSHRVPMPFRRLRVGKPYTRLPSRGKMSESRILKAMRVFMRSSGSDHVRALRSNSAQRANLTMCARAAVMISSCAARDGAVMFALS